MLVQNNQRTNATSCNERSVDNESTKFGGSPRLIEDINNDIEKKYSKKKARRNVFTKYYQEDEMLLENRQPKKIEPNAYFGKDDKKQIQVSEYINTKRPNDPFKGINPLTEKVAIQKD